MKKMLIISMSFLLLTGVTAHAYRNYALKNNGEIRRHESLDDVKRLLEEQGDINKPDGNGLTPLMKAAKEANFSLAKQLIAAGADVFAKDNDGLTALNYASRRGLKNRPLQLMLKSAMGMTWFGNI